MSLKVNNQVYFSSQEPKSIKKILKDKTIPGHEKIGILYSRILQNPEKNKHLFSHLGVSRRDKAAIKELKSLLKTLSKDSIHITKTENSGIFFIEKEDVTTGKLKKVAVFKIGRRRAAMETAARRLAHALGLEKHIIPGMFCAILNPDLELEDPSDELVEELWNSHDKIFGALPSENSSSPNLSPEKKSDFDSL
jgi:hypothetical protein